MKFKSLLALCAFAFTSNAMAENCMIDVEVMDALSFSKKSIEISKSKCDKVTINLKHVGKLPKMTMGHNWVLAKSADMDPIAMDGMKAGLAKNYLMDGDKRVIAATKIIGGGEMTSVTFDTKMLMVGGDYKYFCSFIGHHTVMNGMFVVMK